MPIYLRSSKRQILKDASQGQNVPILHSVLSALMIFLGCFLPTFTVSQEILTVNSGQIRVLDKLTGQVTDLDLSTSEATQVGFLNIAFNGCRIQNDGREAFEFASLLIQYKNEPLPIFSGWMVNTSPALNALDHPRYDVWLLNCSNT